MFYYIFDYYKNKEKYQKEIDLIQLRLADLGIDGEKINATPLRRVEDLVRAAGEKHIDNIIVVGGDRSFHEALSAVLRWGWEVNLGFIPLENSVMGKILGIESGVDGCTTISRRRIEKMDVGVAGATYFLSFLEIGLPAEKGFFTKFKGNNSPTCFSCQLELDNQFFIKAEAKKIIILNTWGMVAQKELSEFNIGNKISPSDGLLNVILVGKMSGKHNYQDKSFLSVKKISLKKDFTAPCLIDGVPIDNFGQNISIIPGRLNVIVGAERLF